MPGRSPVGTNGGHDLFGLAFRHARVIFSGYHHQRDGNVSGAGQRADFLQLGSLFGNALIAIFRSPEIAAIGLGVFQERNEIGDADHFQSGLELVAIAQHRCQRHIAAIAAAGDGDALAVEQPVLAQAVEKSADIEHAVLAQPWTVVEGYESLAKAGRAANIWIEERDTEFIDQIIVPAQKMRLGLAFRAAMDADDQRALALVPCGIGPVEIAGHFLAVEAGYFDQLRRHIGGAVEAAGLAPGPARDGQRFRIDAIGVASCPVAVEGDAQLAPWREFHAADDTSWQSVHGAGRAVFGVIEFEQRTAGLIDFEGDPAPVLADIEIGNVPDLLVHHRFELRCFAIDNAQPLDVAVIVGGCPEPAVGREFEPVIADRLAAFGQLARNAGGKIDQIQLVVADRDIVEHQQLLVIG